MVKKAALKKLKHRLHYEQPLQHLATQQQQEQQQRQQSQQMHARKQVEEEKTPAARSHR